MVIPGVFGAYPHSGRNLVPLAWSLVQERRHATPQDWNYLTTQEPAGTFPEEPLAASDRNEKTGAWADD